MCCSETSQWLCWQTCGQCGQPSGISKWHNALSLPATPSPDQSLPSFLSPFQSDFKSSQMGSCLPYRYSLHNFVIIHSWCVCFVRPEGSFCATAPPAQFIWGYGAYLDTIWNCFTSYKRSCSGNVVVCIIE
jgi:hypothetical protein